MAANSSRIDDATEHEMTENPQFDTFIAKMKDPRVAPLATAIRIFGTALRSPNKEICVSVPTEALSGNSKINPQNCSVAAFFVPHAQVLLPPFRPQRGASRVNFDSTPAVLPKLIRSFLTYAMDYILDSPLWVTAPPSELTVAAEALEKFVMQCAHDRIFAATDSDKAADAAISTRLFVVSRVLLPTDLDIPMAISYVPDGSLEPDGTPPRPPLLMSAISELQQLWRYKTPRDKLVCLANACEHVQSLVQATLAATKGSAGAFSADEFVAALVFVVAIANPPNFSSNIRYIEDYRDPRTLYSGVHGYFFTCIQSVKYFWENVSPDQLQPLVRVLSPPAFAAVFGNDTPPPANLPPEIVSASERVIALRLAGPAAAPSAVRAAPAGGGRGSDPHGTPPPSVPSSHLRAHAAAAAAAGSGAGGGGGQQDGLDDGCDGPPTGELAQYIECAVLDAVVSFLTTESMPLPAEVEAVGGATAVAVAVAAYVTSLDASAVVSVREARVFAQTLTGVSLLDPASKGACRAGALAGHSARNSYLVGDGDSAEGCDAGGWEGDGGGPAGAAPGGAPTASSAPTADAAVPTGAAAEAASHAAALATAPRGATPTPLPPPQTAAPAALTTSASDAAFGALFGPSASAVFPTTAATTAHGAAVHPSVSGTDSGAGVWGDVAAVLARSGPHGATVAGTAASPPHRLTPPTAAAVATVAAAGGAHPLPGAALATATAAAPAATSAATPPPAARAGSHGVVPPSAVDSFVIGAPGAPSALLSTAASASALASPGGTAAERFLAGNPMATPGGRASGGGAGGAHATPQRAADSLSSAGGDTWDAGRPSGGAGAAPSLSGLGASGSHAHALSADAIRAALSASETPTGARDATRRAMAAAPTATGGAASAAVASMMNMASLVSITNDSAYGTAHGAALHADGTATPPTGGSVPASAFGTFVGAAHSPHAHGASLLAQHAHPHANPHPHHVHLHASTGRPSASPGHHLRGGGLEDDMDGAGGVGGSNAAAATAALDAVFGDMAGPPAVASVGGVGGEGGAVRTWDGAPAGGSSASPGSEPDPFSFASFGAAATATSGAGGRVGAHAAPAVPTDIHDAVRELEAFLGDSPSSPAPRTAVVGGAGSGGGAGVRVGAGFAGGVGVGGGSADPWLPAAAAAPPQQIAALSALLEGMAAPANLLDVVLAADDAAAAAAVNDSGRAALIVSEWRRVLGIVEQMKTLVGPGIN